MWMRSSTAIHEKTQKQNQHKNIHLANDNQSLKENNKIK
jgi:hypothetical protein